jgi:hypothetical protein
MRDVARRAAFILATHVWAVPGAVLPIARRLGRGVVIDDSTDLVIEGFPRSGNTLAVAAIGAAQPDGVHIAHHVHAPAHVLEAVRRSVPTLVVIREPGAAADALVESKPFLTRRDARSAYVRFHEPVVRVADRIVVATFEQIHEDLAAIVERLNARFATSFVAPPSDAVTAAAPEVERLQRERTRPGLPLIGGGVPRAQTRDASTDRAGDLEPRAAALYAALASHA